LKLDFEKGREILEMALLLGKGVGLRRTSEQCVLMPLFAWRKKTLTLTQTLVLLGEEGSDARTMR